MEIEIFLPEKGAAYIYKLVDPRDDVVRYVGVTDSPTRRLLQHIEAKQCSSDKAIWINELLSLSLHPRMILIEQIDLHQRKKRERYWIDRFFEEGHLLFNVRTIPAPVFWYKCAGLTIKQTAEELDISFNAVLSLIRNGNLKPVPMVIQGFALYRFNRADIEALKQRPSPAPPAREE